MSDGETQIADINSIMISMAEGFLLAARWHEAKVVKLRSLPNKRNRRLRGSIALHEICAGQFQALAKGERPKDYEESHANDR